MNALHPSTGSSCHDYDGPETPLGDFEIVQDISNQFPETSWQHYVQYLLPCYFNLDDQFMKFDRVISHDKWFCDGDIFSYRDRHAGLHFIERFRLKNARWRSYKLVEHPITSCKLIVLQSGKYTILKAFHPATYSEVMILTCPSGTISLQCNGSHPYVWCDIENVFESGDGRIQFYYSNSDGSCGNIWNKENNPTYDPTRECMKYFFNTIIMDLYH